MHSLNFRMPSSIIKGPTAENGTIPKGSCQDGDRRRLTFQGAVTSAATHATFQEAWLDNVDDDQKCIKLPVSELSPLQISVLPVR